MKLHLVAAAAMVSVFAPVSFAQESPSALKNLTSQQFVDMAASSDMYEIQASKAAEQHAQKEDVKNFAQHMIRDHTESSEKLKAAAQQAGLAAPTSMDAEHAAQLTDLTTGSGFDTKYSQQQVKAHEDAVGLFKAYSSNGDDQALKSFAAETLPTLQEHLRMAQALK